MKASYKTNQNLIGFLKQKNKWGLDNEISCINNRNDLRQRSQVVLC